MIRAALLLLSFGLLTGCTDLTNVNAAIDARVTGGDAYPVLVPVDTLLSTADAPRLDAESGARLVARARRLRYRAARLARRPVLTRAERRRLIDGIKRHATG